MYNIRFFFEYGAGGCLWAGDDHTREVFDVGLLDAGFYNNLNELTRPPRIQLSEEASRLRDLLDQQHATYLNPLYPPDPSLWTQAQCDQFNLGVAALLILLRDELADKFYIIDQQVRYREELSTKG
ncbi:MAG: hypothetical protein ABI459_05020 [Deltaproteobacteria bacterium]